MISVFGARTDGDELAAVAGCLDRSWMGMGPAVRQFEEAFAARLGLPDLVMVDSGSNALYLAVELLRDLGLPPASDVVVPSFTWVACATAVVLAGHRPVFADVDPDTQNVTPETVAWARTPRTGAVMVVHYAGKPADVAGIRHSGLLVIEDAAHAVDSRSNGAACGALGDVAIYSFDAVKNLATPEGGGLTSPHPALLARARELRYCGVAKSGFAAAAAGARGAADRWWEHEVRHAWPKMLPNDVSASIGLAQLRKLDALQARRRQVWDRYQRELGGLDWLRTPCDPDADEQHSYFTYLVRVPGGGRDRLARHLLDRGIYTTLRYHPLHLNPIFRSDARLPVCERLSEEGLNLPLHPGLSDDDVSAVVDAVRGWPG